VACGVCRRPWIMHERGVYRGCYCAWLADRGQPCRATPAGGVPPAATD
jgi:hypothetical protein